MLLFERYQYSASCDESVIKSNGKNYFIFLKYSMECLFLRGMSSSFVYEFLRAVSAKCQNSCDFAAPRFVLTWRGEIFDFRYSEFHFRDLVFKHFS